MVIFYGSQSIRIVVLFAVQLMFDRALISLGTIANAVFPGGALWDSVHWPVHSDRADHQLFNRTVSEPLLKAENSGKAAQRTQEGAIEMQITWKGTAYFLIETMEERIAVDPFFELRGGANAASPEDFNEDTILITHGHFDHLYFVPEILDETDATVFCTQTPAETLEKYTDNADSIVCIRPGMSLPLGDAVIRVYKGRHIAFRLSHLTDTIRPLRVLKHIGNVPFLLWANRSFPENGETVVYEIDAEGKKVLLLGSLALDPEEEYPVGADLLILPYQGNNDLVSAADRILERLQPKRVMLSHFDDAFPPMSRNVPMGGLKRLMSTKYPKIQVVKPAFGKSVEI